MPTDSMPDKADARHRAANGPTAPRAAAAPLALVATALTLAACVEIRGLTYPADFVYLDDETVRGTMHLLAASAGRIDALIAEGLAADDPARVAAIDAELARMQEAAGALGVGASLELEDGERPRTNHLLIDEHVDEFLDDVARARRFAAADPPNLYPAGEIVGSCNGCHRYR